MLCDVLEVSQRLVDAGDVGEGIREPGQDLLELHHLVRFTTQIRRHRGVSEYMPSAWRTVTPWCSWSISWRDRASGWRVMTSNFRADLPPFRMASLMLELR